MEETEAKKTCHKCGADVTHANRHKNRFGEYRCEKCFEAKKLSSRERSHKRARKRSLRILFYVFLIVVACWLFLMLLDMVHRMSNVGQDVSRLEKRGGPTEANRIESAMSPLSVM